MLTFLPEYVFEVKNIYPDERDSKITSLRVEILPHWSETFFFRFCMMVLGGIIVYMVIQRIKLRQKRLEHELRLEHEIFAATVERDKEKQIREFLYECSSRVAYTFNFNLISPAGIVRNRPPFRHRLY